MQIFGDTLEEIVLTILLERGPAVTTDLMDRVLEQKSCTRQGFYRALRKLRDSEKIVIYCSRVSINELWARRVRSLFETSTKNLVGDLSKLESGEKVVLSLKGLSATDRVWSHLFSVLEQEIPKKYPLYLYNPHNWSALLRRETDIEHEQALRRRSRAVYLVIGSNTVLDKAATKNIGFKHIQFSFNPRISESGYIASIGEYILEIRFSSKTQKAIEALFKKEEGETNARNTLQKIDRTASCKIVVERNPKKARQWERRIGNDFYFPKKR